MKPILAYQYFPMHNMQGHLLDIQLPSSTCICSYLGFHMWQSQVENEH